MDDSELRKIRQLMDRMDAICRESEEIRAQLDQLAQQTRRHWPDQRSVAQMFDRLPPLSGKPTPGSDESVN
jgi:hypothetical protein